MSRNPFGPDELDRTDLALDRVADRLERYAFDQRTEPPLDLAARIRSAIAEEPEPTAGWWISLTAGLGAWRAPARGIAVVAVLVASVVGAFAIGELVQNVREANVGASPSPAPVVSPTPTPSPTVSPSPSATPTPSPSPTVSPTPMPTVRPIPVTPLPAASDDDGGDGGGSGSGSDD